MPRSCRHGADHVVVALFLLAGCSGAQQRHDERLSTDAAMNDAINGPAGADYVRALELVRGSNRTQAEKDLTGGMLILQSREGQARRRPPETIADGMMLVECAATGQGTVARAAAGQLRRVFQRGMGSPTPVIAPDRAVAECWQGVVSGGGDAPRCVALRQAGVRLPAG